MSADGRRGRRAVAAGTCAPVVMALVAALVAGRPGRADVPAGCYTVAGGTVADSQTGLVWQRGTAAGFYTWTQAQDYCAALTVDGAAGWRLPSVKELTTLVDFGRFDPAIDPGAFPATPSDFFWSSSAGVGQAGTAWVVNFTRGSGGAATTDSAGLVRCVR